MPNERDLEILRHILKYCDEIAHTADVFGKEYQSFSDNTIYQNATALCVLQIGELTTHLTDEFKKTYNKMPWNQIKALRNVVAHNYGKIDKEILWETLTQDIPELKAYCSSIISS
ncbi:MAG: DUF86 domain-containing protein [Lachnospiraceae bacterium]|nr:DUF86 domain-containing protein [Lachnospiraceae bacterium]